MGNVRIIGKCLGIIGFFALPLFVVSILYYLFITLSGNMPELGSFLTGYVKSLIPSSHASIYFHPF